jgi:hypothetical protein
VALAAMTLGAGAAPAKPPPFNGIIVKMTLVSVDTAASSGTVRVEAGPSGNFAEGNPDSNVLNRDVVLYTTTVNGSVGHNYRAGNFMDPFETTVPLEGDTSAYPFYHLGIKLGALATTSGGVKAGEGVRLQLNVVSSLSGYRVSPNDTTREGTGVVEVDLHVDPSWATVVFAVFIMVVMWALALGAVSVAVNLIRRRRKFEGSFTTLLAALLFAFPTVRNNLPGIPPVGVLFDYVAFFWAEALVALSLIALLTGWTLRALMGTTDPKKESAPAEAQSPPQPPKDE